MAGVDPFPGTRWSLVRQAGEGHRDALETLCGAYWLPLYAYVRRRGLSEPDAQDRVQAFLTRFLERNDFERISPEGGRFRAYLLVSIKRFLANERDRDRAQKRGGGVAPLSLSWTDAEGRYRQIPDDGLTPEEAYERQWTLLLLERAVQRVRSAAKRKDVFDALRPALTGGSLDRSYAELATTLGMTESAIKVTVHRGRAKLREALNDEVLATVDDPSSVDEELRYLLTRLGG